MLVFPFSKGRALLQKKLIFNIKPMPNITSLAKKTLKTHSRMLLVCAWPRNLTLRSPALCHQIQFEELWSVVYGIGAGVTFPGACGEDRCKELKVLCSTLCVFYLNNAPVTPDPPN